MQGVRHLVFQLIPYDELTEAEIQHRLQQAEFIIGAESIVGKTGALCPKYARYLRADVEVIGARRIATDQSVANIIRWTRLFHHKQVVDEIALTSQGISTQLDEVARVTQEFSVATGSVTNSIQQTSDKSASVVGRIQQFADIARSLAEAVQKIGGIAGAIRHISGQTNLLALNAAIEAARVGEQGRGFAVVAQEVKKLAEESRAATETIRGSVVAIESLVHEIGPLLSSTVAELENCMADFRLVSDTTQEEIASVAKISESLHTIQNISSEQNAIVKKLMTQ